MTPTSPSPAASAEQPDTGPAARVPSPEELAAIVAAVEAAWPRPVVPAVQEAERPSPWRFSGRWWSGPTTVRRERPWVQRNY